MACEDHRAIYLEATNKFQQSRMFSLLLFDKMDARYIGSKRGDWQ